MKRVYQTIAIILLCLAFCFAGCKKEVSSHNCRFELCPYKGFAYFPGVINTGESEVDKDQNGTDTWVIDRLHFDYPNDNYNELETRLETSLK